MLLDVFHFSFTVADLDRSTDWYTNILGLEFVLRQRQENEYTRTLVGIPDAVLEVAQFRIHAVSSPYSTHMLELVEYIHPKSTVGAAGMTNDVGVAHICFVVPDIASEYRRLKEIGVYFCNPPVEIRAGVNLGGKACYFRDLDGITLELHEPPLARKRALGLV